MGRAIRWPKRTRSRVALAVGVPLVAVVGLGQALGPTLAAQRVRARLAPYGTVRSVSVSAFPAVEMLWGKADSVTVTARDLRLSEAQAVKLAWEARGVHELRVRVSTLDLAVAGLPGPLALHDAAIVRLGKRLLLRALVAESDLAAALPSGFQVQPLANEGDGLRVRASGGLFGARASLEALVEPRAGRLVAVPQGLPLAGLFQVTLFADDHLQVERLSFFPVAGRPGSWALALNGMLH